ncbi:UNVERIFIED_ORG: hypothetical protein GGI66_006194 [Rhizobium esperanzae]
MKTARIQSVFGISGNPSAFPIIGIFGDFHKSSTNFKNDLLGLIGRLFGMPLAQLTSSMLKEVFGKRVVAKVAQTLFDFEDSLVARAPALLSGRHRDQTLDHMHNVEGKLKSE